MAVTKLTPLVLDLDGNGIELGTLNSSDSVYFDMNNDGFAEATAWVRNGDGLLALDINGDTIINNSEELFGDQTGHANGFLALASYDQNGDGAITAEDAVYGELRVWVDDNNNGYSETGELHTLSSLGITSIGTGYNDVDIANNGNSIFQSGTYTVNGEARDIVDAYFEVDLANSLYNQSFELDVTTLGMPGLRGYGTMPALYIGMSLDNDRNDPDSLISLVQDFSEKSISDIFAANTAALDDARAILFRWAGVEDVVAGSRGNDVNAAELAVLEKLTGAPFLQNGHNPNPGYRAGFDLSQAFDVVINHYLANLAVQGAARTLFEGDTSYDIYRDGFTGITGLNLTTLATLQGTATSLANTADRTVFWTNVVRVADYVFDEDTLGGDSTALSAAITASDATLDLFDIRALLIDAQTWATVNGTSGVDTLAGGAGADEVTAAAGNDTIDAGGGDDLVYGGNDNDAYIYNSGDGEDVYSDTAGTDKILFDASIDAGDLTMTRTGYDLVIDINNGIHTGQIVIDNHFSGSRGVETIDFNGGSTLNLTTMNNWVYNGTDNNETLQGVIVNGGTDDIINGNGGNDKVYGLAGNDTLHGNDGTDTVEGSTGNDVIYGGAGNDRLSGSAGDDKVYGGDGNDTILGGPGTNTLDGGAGNDTIFGGSSADRYEYSGGNDVIREGGGTDSIYLSPGFSEANVHYYRIGNDLKIQFSATDSITIKNFHTGRGYQVETLNFNGGSAVTLANVMYFLQGDESANTLTGGTANDELLGNGGNDVLSGDDGNDYLVGGAGDDTMTGGAGNDTLEGGAGTDTYNDGAGADVYVYTGGADQINDTGTDSNDVVRFIDGWELTDISFERDVSDLGDLILNFGNGNTVTLENQFAGGSTYKIETLLFSDASTDNPNAHAVTTVGSAGADYITGIDTFYVPYNIEYGYAGNDTLVGHDGDDFLYGGDENDSLSGGSGNDCLEGGTGDDTLNGYYGDDTIVYSGGNDYVVVDQAGYDTIVMSAEWSLDDVQSILALAGNDLQIDFGGGNSILFDAHFTGGDGHFDMLTFADGTFIDLDDIHDSLKGYEVWGGGTADIISRTSSTVGETIMGFAGNDAITGSGYDDYIDGGTGDDTMTGGAGNDTFVVDSASDVITDASGTDTVIAGLTYTLAGGFENLTLSGTGNFTATGSTGDNTLAGNSGANSLVGGSGNDTYIYDDAADTLVEGSAAGTDTVVSSFTHTLATNFENLTLAGTTAINGTGNSGDNTLTGNAAANTLGGGTGNDTYVVTDLLDTLVESAAAGTDTVLANINTTLGTNFENLTLSGISDINGTGNSVVNVLTGNAGNNALDGAGGVDTMIGGLGNDTYIVDNTTEVVSEASSAGTDTVLSSATYTLATNVENLVLTGTSIIHGTGNTLANTLTGNSAANSLTGDSGNDTLDGAAGADTLAGGANDDTYMVDNAGDVVTEGSASGLDTVLASVNYALTTDVENLTLTGSANISATGNTLANTLTGNAGTNTLIGGLGNDVYNIDSVLDLVTEASGEGTDTVQSSVTYSLTTNVENLTLMGSNNINATGNTAVNILNGNGGDNTLDGGTGADSMIGGAGNDTFMVDNTLDVLSDTSGTDTVISTVDWMLGAGFENLTLSGSAVNGTGNTIANYIIGNASVNVLNAGTGVISDTLDGGAGADTMIGGAGDDLYHVDNTSDLVSEAAASGTDTVYSSVTLTLASDVENLTLTGSSNLNATGNSGKNTLTGNSGTNTLTGGAGNDTYVVDSLSDTLVEGAGADVDAVLSSVSWTLSTDFENLTLTGSSNINGTGNSVVNTLTGNSGNNTLNGAAGADSMIGGTGDDYYLVDNISDVISEAASGGTDTVESSVNYTLASEVDNLILTGSAVTGTGNSGNNTLTGNANTNTLIGGTGNDYYIVDSGSDIVSEATNSGTDAVQSSATITLATNVENLILTGGSALNGTGNASANILTGNTGANTLDGNTGIDTLIGGQGNDTYLVDSTTDIVSENASEGTDAILATLASGTYLLGANVENLTLGGTLASSGTGNILVNILTGNNAANTLDGDAGADTMIGGAGNDAYFVDNAGDVVSEAASSGTDTVNSSVSYTLATDLENLILTGIAQVNATGNGSVNTLTGNIGNNTLDGLVGADSMIGGAGDDAYIVDNASDKVTEVANEGNDTVHSGVTWTLGNYVENLVLTGGSTLNGTGNTLDNVMTGNSGNNTLTGGAGSDTLAGAAGIDVLIGGTDNDVYIVDSSDTVSEASLQGTDTIMADFTYTIAALTNVENLTLTGSSNINGTGNTLDNIITGNAGNNTLLGGLGNDTYYVGEGTDIVSENASEGTDIVIASTSWTLATNVENLILDGFDDMDGTGNTGDNTITGNSGINILSGNSGADTLDGKENADTLIGGSGNDVYIVDNANDIVSEIAAEGTDSVQTSVTYTLSAEVENLTLTGVNTIHGTGNASANIITGNSNNNTLDGAAGADSLIGGGGNDVYIVDNISDSLTEGPAAGTDSVQSSVNWTLATNFENLTLTGASTITGTGNTLDNTITGNGAVNVLNGSDGADTLDGGVGADTLIGGIGNDAFVVDNASDVLSENASEGTDLVQSAVTWTLGTNFENLTLTGTSNVNATGNSVVNTLTGNSGNNTLDGGAGADTMAGSSGDDVYVVDNAGDIIIDTSGTDTVMSNLAFTLVSGLENLTLTGSSGVTATGNTGNNTLTGNTGANSLIGGLGDDTYVWTDAADTIVELADQGIDTVLSSLSLTLGSNLENLTLTGSSNVNATGNSLNNTLTGNSGNNTLAGGLGDDTYIWDSASDTISEASSAGTDTVLSSLTLTLGSNLENLALTGASTINGTGNTLDNVITGNSAANTLSGSSGHDTLDGGADNDIMIGGNGNDVFYVDSTSDTVSENSAEGTDTVMSYVDWTISSNFENLTLLGFDTISGTGNSGVNTITGNAAVNTLNGGDGNDTLDGGAGDDLLIGGIGNDLFIVDSITDVVSEGASAGTDTIQSTVHWTLGTNIENLNLSGSSALNGTGNSSANVMSGNSGVNTLDGGSGNDTLNGGGGMDVLTGGANADTFVFTPAGAYTGVVTVTDFSTGQADVIDLSDLLTEYDPMTEVLTDFVRIADSGSDSLVSVDRDGLGVTYGWTQVATLTGVIGLTNEAALVSSGNLVVT
ncbi:MAG TPA: calcium-binding protein [Patescibacteria group bacterium]|nr:calcium-binding protein [Patescibacteria group bacterium]